MDVKAEILAILDKNIDQEQLAKDLYQRFLRSRVVEVREQILAEKIDLLPNTNVDNVAAALVIDFLLGELDKMIDRIEPGP